MARDTIKTVTGPDSDFTWTSVTGTDLPGDKRGLDVSVGGGTLSITPSGLNKGGKITEITLDSTSWTALPPTPLTDRNALAILNPASSGTEIKLNYDYTAALPAGYEGMPIPIGFERQYDITDSVVVYAKSASGTPTIIVEELA